MGLVHDDNFTSRTRTHTQTETLTYEYTFEKSKTDGTRRRPDGLTTSIDGMLRLFPS